MASQEEMWALWMGDEALVSHRHIHFVMRFANQGMNPTRPKTKHEVAIKGDRPQPLSVNPNPTFSLQTLFNVSRHRKQDISCRLAA